eukprot:14145872-Heterocapsa_arctica.AAC.1
MEAKAAAKAAKKAKSLKRKAAALNDDPAGALDMEILESLDSQLMPAPAVTPTAITPTAPAAIAAGAVG